MEFLIYICLLFDISDFQMLIEYGKDLLDLTKKFNSSLALPIMTQVGVCSVLCTITCYATLIIIIRFRALNPELAIACLGNSTMVRYFNLKRFSDIVFWFYFSNSNIVQIVIRNFHLGKVMFIWKFYLQWTLISLGSSRKTE